MRAGPPPAGARRGIAFNEVCGDDDPAFDQLLRERTGGLTCPR
jgi:hypothetical protein